jgi:hypothetical protein
MISVIRSEEDESRFQKTFGLKSTHHSVDEVVDRQQRSQPVPEDVVN